MKQFLTFSVLLFCINVHAKPKVSVAKFEIKTGDAHCNPKGRKSDPSVEYQKQFVDALNRFGRVHAVPLEAAVKANSQYTASGSISTSGICGLKRGETAKVAIEIRVINSQTGTLAFSYSTSVNIKSSPYNEATRASINELAFRAEQNLLGRKSAVRLVSKNRKMASSTEYQIKLVKKER